MSDIVERLRAWHTPGETITGDVQLYLDAADEIKRLRKQADADVVTVNTFLAQRDQAEAEVERQRDRITWLQEQIEDLQKVKELT